MSSREIFKEFEFLLEKSQKSFNRLRDLPPYGNTRWEQLFHKAFHIYSKLWKFQQDHRCVATASSLSSTGTAPCSTGTAASTAPCQWWSAWALLLHIVAAYTATLTAAACM
jgi:hypothetical protein